MSGDIKKPKINVEVGDIFFTMDNSFLSRAFRYVESGGVNYDDIPSHGGIVSGANGAIEANWTGVRRITLEKYMRKGVKLWFGRIKDPKDVKEMMDWVEGQIGARYAYWQLAAILLLAAKQWVTFKLKPTRMLLAKAPRQGFICSELISRASRKAGHSLTAGDPNFDTPLDVFSSNELTIFYNENF